MDERMKGMDARTRSNHDALARVRERESTRGEALIRIEGKVEEQGDDIAEMKNDMKWIKRGLFGAIAVGMMFTVAVASLVIQAAH
jgi:hypothetical protein